MYPQLDPDPIVARIMAAGFGKEDAEKMSEIAKSAATVFPGALDAFYSIVSRLAASDDKFFRAFGNMTRDGAR